MKKEFIDKVIKSGVVDTKKYRYVYSVSAEKAEIRRIAIDLLDTTATINGWEIVKVIDDGTNQFGICACIRSIESSRDLIAKGDVEKVFAYLSGVETKNGPFFNKTMWDAFDIVFPGYRENMEPENKEEKAVCFHCGGECHSDRYPEVVFSSEGIHICEECSIDFEEVCGVPVPRFVEVLTYEKIGVVIEALKKAVAPLEAEMEADNIPKEKWLELDKEVTQTWEKIGVLQYLQIVQGTGVDPSGRKFRDVEMGEIVTIDDVLHTWAAYKEIREEHPHFPKYLGNCQTFKGGTLEEIR